MVNLTETGTSRFVQTKDWNIHYNEAGTGHPVLLLHGSGAGATGWSNFSQNVGALADHFHVFALDLPGWGRSEAVTVDRLRHAEAVVQFMDSRGLEKAALVGNSMGGVAALTVATRQPHRVSHLITMGPVATRAPRLFTPGGLTEGLKILFRCYQEPTFENMKLLCQVMMFDPGSRLDDLANERLAATLDRPEHLRNVLTGIPQGSPVPDWFELDDLLGLGIPALLIHGRDDRVVHYEHTLTLLSYLPNARALLLNRCGHWAMVEHPDEFNRAVTDFITNN